MVRKYKSKPPLDEKLCENCGNGFIPSKFWQIYCSRFCSQAAYYKRKAPPSIETLDTPTGPTPRQIAEWERRKNENPDENPRQGDKDPRTPEIVRQSQLYDVTPIADLGYGPKEEKE